MIIYYDKMENKWFDIKTSSQITPHQNDIIDQDVSDSGFSDGLKEMGLKASYVYGVLRIVLIKKGGR